MNWSMIGYVLLFLCAVIFSFVKKRKSLATKNCNLQFSWGLITATYTFWISCKHADNLTWQHNYTFCGVLAAKLLFFEKFFRETHRNGGTLACMLCCQRWRKGLKYAGASDNPRPFWYIPDKIWWEDCPLDPSRFQRLWFGIWSSKQTN